MAGDTCHSMQKQHKLKKGLWSPEEDEKLFTYINRFGVGSWTSVPHLAGLERCGKSCRLRWVNYLRPGLKRGSFSQQEQDIIVHLHRLLGNRWAQIATKLPEMGIDPMGYDCNPFAQYQQTNCERSSPSFDFSDTLSSRTMMDTFITEESRDSSSFTNYSNMNNLYAEVCKYEEWNASEWQELQKVQYSDAGDLDTYPMGLLSENHPRSVFH